MQQLHTSGKPSVRVVQWRSESGVRPALIQEKRKRIIAVFFGDGATTLCRALPKSESLYMQDIDYSVRKAAKAFRARAQTKGARAALRGL